MVSVRLVGLASVKTAARRTSSGTSSSSESQAPRQPGSTDRSSFASVFGRCGALLRRSGDVRQPGPAVRPLGDRGPRGGLPSGRGQPGGRSRRRGQRLQQG
ncbi:unnamed protein product, partial [Ectocarpus sp. 6 AP-2014]